MHNKPLLSDLQTGERGVIWRLWALQSRSRTTPRMTAPGRTTKLGTCVSVSAYEMYGGPSKLVLISNSISVANIDP
jgi:hypothetical protein